MLTITISATIATGRHMKQPQRVTIQPIMDANQYQDGVKSLFGRSTGPNLGTKEGKILPPNNLHASIRGVGLGSDKNGAKHAPNRGPLPKPNPVGTHDVRTPHSYKNVATNAESLQEPVGTHRRLK